MSNSASVSSTHERTVAPLPFQLWGMSPIPPINPGLPRHLSPGPSEFQGLSPSSFFSSLPSSPPPPLPFSLLGTKPRPHAHKASPLTTEQHPGPSLPSQWLSLTPKAWHKLRDISHTDKKKKSRPTKTVLGLPYLRQPTGTNSQEKVPSYSGLASMSRSPPLHSCGSDLGLWPLATQRPHYRTVPSRNRQGSAALLPRPHSSLPGPFNTDMPCVPTSPLLWSLSVP